MERYGSPRTLSRGKSKALTRELEEDLDLIRAAEGERERRRLAEKILERRERKKRQSIRNRKILGGVLSLVGLATTVSTCPLYAISLTGPEMTIAGLGVIVLGGLLIFIHPNRHGPTDALAIALKGDGTLTVTRLALELDVSVEKAEKIMAELVKSGLAEIDLDKTDPDDLVAYRIKGL